MIFVTTGTTMPFDELIEEIDRLSAEGRLGEPVICQIGHSAYEPNFCEWFRFKPSIDELFQKADIVITHGGSTVLHLLQSGSKFVAMPNPRGADDHQGEMLEMLSKRTKLFWSRDVKDLDSLIRGARENAPQRLAEPRLGDEILSFLEARTEHR